MLYILVDKRILYVDTELSMHAFQWTEQTKSCDDTTLSLASDKYSVRQQFSRPEVEYLAYSFPSYNIL